MVDRGTQRSLFLVDPPLEPELPADPLAGAPAPPVEGVLEASTSVPADLGAGSG